MSMESVSLKEKLIDIIERHGWFTEITDELDIKASKRISIGLTNWDVQLLITTSYQHIVILSIVIENNENYFSVNNYNIQIYTPLFGIEYEERREFRKQLEHIIFNDIEEFKKLLNNDIELLKTLFKVINDFLESQSFECQYIIDEIIAGL